MKTAQTQDYIHNLLHFKADIILRKMHSASIGLAASGCNHNYKLLKNAGSWRDEENRVIVRVYEKKENGDYLVFFIFDDIEPEFAIISHPRQFKYYLLGTDNSIVIPKSDGIDPMCDRLNISFPIDIFQTRVESLTENPESLLAGEKGMELSYSYRTDPRSLEILILPSIDETVFDGTKILIITQANEELQNEVRLFPLSNRQVDIPLPKVAGDLLTLCIYR